MSMTLEEIADQIIKRFEEERKRLHDYQMAGHSIESYDHCDLKQIILEVLEKEL